MKEALTGIQDVEPVINLMSLYDLIDLMQHESEINYRHVVLLPMAPSTPMSGANSDAASTIGRGSFVSGRSNVTNGWNYAGRHLDLIEKRRTKESICMRKPCWKRDE